MNILIVEDKEDNRNLLEALLKGNGHDVEAAANGAEALERLKAGGIELIISDILMPVMDGFQLCRKVKTDEALRHIPFIIYTATYTGPQDEAFAIKIGADQFIQKPCEPDVFMEAVRDVMAAAKGRDIASTPVPVHEEEMLKLYSERLVRKLEQKMLELEKEVRTRREAEEALAKRERKYRMLAENTLDVIWAMDLDLTFTYVNPAVVRLMGYSPEEWIGSRLPEHCDEENFVKMAQIIADEVAKGSDGAGVILEVVLLNKNREPVPVEIHGRVMFDENGAPIFLQGVTRDISERKRAEKMRKDLESQLHQALRMESIGTLAGGIAHDFNNILSSIIGYTELSLDDVDRNTELASNLREVYTAGLRAKDLVKQILIFARQANEEIKPVQVDIIVKEALKFLRSSVPTSIEIRQDIESDSLIMADPTQVHQIVMNLCTNAAQAMHEEGGVLSVGLTDVRLDSDFIKSDDDLKPGHYLKLSMSDTGSGMPPDVMKSIFEPYFTTKMPGEGTGMGLATVYGIVKNYGGKIMVESEVEKGSTFTVYLPITNKCTGAAPCQEEELPSGTERILFIDDEAPIAKMGSQILERLGYSVTMRTSGVEALELFRSKPKDFDLVITDMTMPNMTGDKLAMELIAFRADIPVILYTGYSKKISDETALEIGIKAFAYKPIVKADLAKTVRKVLDEG
jgi:PAS domain S-box-containing protein